MSFDVVQCALRPVQAQAVAYQPEIAAELREAGWIDDVHQSLTRTNRGPLPCGIVRPTPNSQVQVDPGDVIVMLPSGKRVVFSPAEYGAMYETISARTEHHQEQAPEEQEQAATTPDDAQVAVAAGTP